MKIGDNDTGKTQVKTRNWNFVVFLDSAPEGLYELMDEKKNDRQAGRLHHPKKKINQYLRQKKTPPSKMHKKG